MMVDAQVFHMNGGNSILTIGAAGNEGDLNIVDGEGRNAFQFNSESAVLTVGASGNEGDITVLDGQGRQVFKFNSDPASLVLGAQGNEGDLYVRNSAGNDTIHLDGESGDIILSNADFAEDFEVADPSAAEPGTVMVLDDTGKLVPSTSPYDRRVAGIVTGAGSYKPGIIMDRHKDRTHRRPIAMVGKVFCRIDADLGGVAVGDLLTTAPTPGHAMRAADPSRAIGSVIGKALAPLSSGRGLVPVLISLL